MNCGGAHKANDKKCSTYIYNKNIQEVNALRNLTYYESKKIVDDKQVSYENRWIRPRNWPELSKKTMTLPRRQETVTENQREDSQYVNKN